MAIFLLKKMKNEKEHLIYTLQYIMKNMKWIKSRQKFLNEAKLRDVIFKKQAEKVKEMWGEKFLDYEEITPTDKIKQGKWKLSDEDKMRVLGKFFDADMNRVFEIFSSLPDKFAEILSKSINTELIRGGNKEKYEVVFKDFNIKSPSIGQIVSIFDNVFRKLSVNDTVATEMISRDENGRPLKDENNNMIKTAKEAGDPVFSNNLVNINSFLDDYNRCYPDNRVESGLFNNHNISSVRNLAMEDHNGDYKVDFDIFGKDIYLSISHNPKDILNMSISKFYSSCQHLYSGVYNSQVLGNVFDPNSIPAFLTFETPIYWRDEKISDQLPLSRMVIRNMEGFDNNGEPMLFHDRAYPDRMRDIFMEIVDKYSGNKHTEEAYHKRYLFTPDIDHDDDSSTIRDPYMDKLGIDRGKFIGVNTKRLYLSRISDWSKYKISPKAKIKELIVETTDLPENLLSMDINLDWIKFKFLKIKTLSNFDKIKSNAIGFDKCSFDGSILNTLKESNPGLNRLSITACDITNMNLSSLGELDELQLVYTLERGVKLQEAMNGVSTKKLVVSGDVVSDKDNKSYLGSLKSKGVKVEIVGPVI